MIQVISTYPVIKLCVYFRRNIHDTNDTDLSSCRFDFKENFFCPIFSLGRIIGMLERNTSFGELALTVSHFMCQRKWTKQTQANGIAIAGFSLLKLFTNNNLYFMFLFLHLVMLLKNLYYMPPGIRKQIFSFIKSVLNSGCYSNAIRDLD